MVVASLDWINWFSITSLCIPFSHYCSSGKIPTVHFFFFQAAVERNYASIDESFDRRHKTEKLRETQLVCHYSCIHQFKSSDVSYKKKGILCKKKEFCV